MCLRGRHKNAPHAHVLSNIAKNGFMSSTTTTTKFPTPHLPHRAFLLPPFPFSRSDRPPLLPPQTPRHQRRGPKDNSRDCQTTAQSYRAEPSSSFCNVWSDEAIAPQPSAQGKDDVIPLQKQHSPAPHTVPQRGRGGRRWRDEGVREQTWRRERMGENVEVAEGSYDAGEEVGPAEGGQVCKLIWPCSSSAGWCS